MIGCEGIQPPELDTQAPNTPCNRTGECNAEGVCSVQVPSFCRLDETPDAKFYCGDGLENGERYCEYFVEPPNDGRTRCIDFCQSLGMTICDQSAGEQPGARFSALAWLAGVAAPDDGGSRAGSPAAGSGSEPCSGVLLSGPSPSPLVGPATLDTPAACAASGSVTGEASGS